jgi:hypothetical protein
MAHVAKYARQQVPSATTLGGRTGLDDSATPASEHCPETVRKLSCCTPRIDSIPAKHKLAFCILILVLIVIDPIRRVTDENRLARTLLATLSHFIIALPSGPAARRAVAAAAESQKPPWRLLDRTQFAGRQGPLSDAQEIGSLLPVLAPAGTRYRL